MIPSLVSFAGAMKPDIHKIRGYDFRRPATGQMIQAKGSMIFCEQIVDGLGEPAFVAKFESIPECFWQDLQKFFQPEHVHPPTRRQLKQDRSPFVAQHGDGFKKSFNALLRIFQLFHVGDKTAALTGE